MRIYELLQLAENSPSQFKSWLTKQLTASGVAITSSSRGGIHIRFPLQGEMPEFKNFFDKLGIEVADTSTRISGTFDTYQLTMKQGNDMIPAGTSLFWVNNYTGKDSKQQKTFGDKELTPETMNLASKEADQKEILSILDNTIKESYPDYYKSLMEMAKRATGSGNSISLSGIDLSEFSQSDLTTISKNYGEVLSAIWSMSNLDFEQVQFPKISNNRMIDFYGERENVDYPVSVKSGGGGKVTITNIIDALQDKVIQGKVNPAEQKSYMVFKLVKENGAKEGIVKLHTYFKTAPIKKLAQIMKVSVEDINIESINEWLEKFSNNNDIKKALTPFLEVMKMKITDDIWQRNDRLRFVVSPLGEWIWKFLNNNEEIRGSMTQLARQMSIIQVNIDVKKSLMYFQHNRFENAEFMFGWAGYAAGNKLGFKMNLGNK